MPLESERAVDLADGLTKLQLASLDACVRCHACLEWCPVFDILGDEQITPPEKIRIYGEMLRLQLGMAEAPDDLNASDALAVALCHAMQHRAAALLAASS